MNKLIVESNNDKYFIEKLIDVLNISNIEISEPICTIDEYICLDGISKLKNKLQDEKLENIDKLGIVLDADKVGIEYRLKEVNKILQNLDINVNFSKNNELKYDKNNDIYIACHILNVDGYGELEDILYKIKKVDSVYADCLHSWKDCLENNSKIIKDKDFIKFWVNIYIRFDTCDKKEQKQSHRKCNFEASMKKDIWDFDDNILNDLKEFLKLFSNKDKNV